MCGGSPSDVSCGGLREVGHVDRVRSGADQARVPPVLAELGGHRAVQRLQGALVDPLELVEAQRGPVLALGGPSSLPVLHELGGADVNVAFAVVQQDPVGTLAVVVGRDAEYRVSHRNRDLGHAGLVVDGAGALPGHGREPRLVRGGDPTPASVARRARLLVAVVAEGDVAEPAAVEPARHQHGGHGEV